MFGRFDPIYAFKGSENRKYHNYTDQFTLQRWTPASVDNHRITVTHSSDSPRPNKHSIQAKPRADQHQQMQG